MSALCLKRGRTSYAFGVYWHAGDRFIQWHICCILCQKEFIGVSSSPANDLSDDLEVTRFMNKMADGWFHHICLCGV